MSIVVIVDDEPALLEVLGMVLEGDGHDVRRATTREHAMQVLAGVTPDIIECPDLTLTRALRSVPALASVSIVLLVEPADCQPPLDAGVHALNKPVVLAELRRLVRGV